MIATLATDMPRTPDAGGARTEVVTFRVTKAQRKLIDAISKRLGPSWVREYVAREAERLADLAVRGELPAKLDEEAERLERLTRALQAPAEKRSRPRKPERK